VLRIAYSDGTRSYKVLISDALLTDTASSPLQLHQSLIYKDIASRIKQELAGLYVPSHETGKSSTQYRPTASWRLTSLIKREEVAMVIYLLVVSEVLYANMDP
jgi:hypothetical protein